MTARFVSDLLNPLTLPVLVFGIAGLTTDASVKDLAGILGISTVLFIIIPAFTATVMIKFGQGNNFDFHFRTNRIGLYLISILSVGLGGLFIFNEIYTHLYAVILTIYLINLTVAFLLNFKMKVSVHVGSVVTASVLLSWLVLLNLHTIWLSLMAVAMVSLIPLISWSRFQLNVHSWFEIVLGGIMGFTITILMLLFLA